MRWVAKAVLQKALSWCPASEELNYFFQRRVTRNYPRREDEFFRFVGIAAEHCDIFLKFGRSPSLSDAVFYEFGTGWDLIIPLAYYALGVDHQTLVDISPLMRLDLVGHTLRRFADFRAELERRLQRPLRALQSTVPNTAADLKSRFGIEYLAPVDAQDTKLPSNSFDFVSSTSTLEHVPEADILGIFTECKRLLKPGGVISSRIDMTDHFAYFDRGLSCYSFLRWSGPIWEIVTSPLSYQNRLRYPDYLDLAGRSGLQVIFECHESPTPDDLKTLEGMKLAAEFRKRYSLEDLGVKRLKMVCTAVNGSTRDLGRHSSAPGEGMRQASDRDG